MAARQGMVATLVLLAGVGLAGCKSSSSAEAEAETDGSAKVSAVEGKEGIHRVELTADGMQRIGLKTDTVKSLAAAAKPTSKSGATKAGTTDLVSGKLIVPLSAVLYDKDGATWVYISTDKLAFQREQVKITGVDGELAVLSSGPPVGTPVVTVGAPELLGAEDGVPGE